MGCYREDCTPKPKCVACDYYFVDTPTSICPSCKAQKINYCDSCGESDLDQAVKVAHSQTIICFKCLSKCNKKVLPWVLERCHGKPTYLEFSNAYLGNNRTKFNTNFQTRLVKLVKAAYESNE